MSRELRFNTIKELRVVRGETGSHIEGYAATFNSLSEDLGGFREVIKPGCFTRALNEKHDVRALINHDPNMILGRNKAKTLELSQDDKGLKFRVALPNTSYARDLAESIDRGDMDQCSFGFEAVQQRWTNSKENPEYADATNPQQNCMVRELHDVNLFDISAVTYPAYSSTSVSLRSLNAARSIMEECECKCEECEDDNCMDCSHEGCDCEGCQCLNSIRSRQTGETTENDTERLRCLIEIAKRK